MKRTRIQYRERRHKRARQKVRGTPERPRLAAQKSLRHIYAQVIDDVAGVTLAAVTTATKANLESGRKSFANKEFAKIVGMTVAARAKEKGITRVVFDCGGNLYHGCIKALADAAREGGLEF